MDFHERIGCALKDRDRALVDANGFDLIRAHTGHAIPDHPIPRITVRCGGGAHMILRGPGDPHHGTDIPLTIVG